MSILQEIKEGVALLEVSKTLLGRYINKAAGNIEDHGFDQGRASMKYDGHEPYLKSKGKAEKRQQGIKKAVVKLAQEETELEEGKRRGRPKKPRHEDGEIVNDPDANDTRPAN